MNRKELYDFAKSLDQKDAPVGALIQAIDEANQQLNYAVYKIASKLDLAKQHVGSFEVAADGFVHRANDYAIAAAKLNTLFLTLAVVLQQQGHKVDY